MLPFFYTPVLNSGPLTLDEDTSRHVTGVLRMGAGARLMLTDGKGGRAGAVVQDPHRKRCTVEVGEVVREAALAPRVVIAISLVKNPSRFEWFLEKAAEIGVSEILPLICARTEKEKFRDDRLRSILQSAMLQSQQCWMPELHAPAPFSDILHRYPSADRFIAHCLPEERTSLTAALQAGRDRFLLVGPEGDFTPEEIEAATGAGFRPVSLGPTRLRTETAGLAGALLLRNSR